VVVGELDGQRSPRIEALHRLLQDFEPDTRLSDNIFGYLWGKAGYGAILKASALTNDTMAEFIGNPRRHRMIAALVQEILAVARAERVTPLGDFAGFEPEAFMTCNTEAITASLEAMEDFNRDSPKPRSGIWRDLAVRKRTTDVAAQLDPVRAAARRHGLRTPIVDRLVALITDIEQGRAMIGPDLADDLARVAERR
jgi:2-dehydropantoate 2-reductase